MIEIDNVSHQFDGRSNEASHHVLNNINLHIGEQRVAIIGANGSGKSTFVRMLNGLVIPNQGKVTIDHVDTKKDLKKVRQKVGFIFQNPDNQIVYPIVKEDLSFGLKNLKFSKQQIDAKIDDILTQFHLNHLASRYTHELSGGEKQMIAICGVLVMQPEYIVFDEPTTLLDLRNKQYVHNIIFGMSQKAIVVTHDLDMLSQFDRVIGFDNGEVVIDDYPQVALRQYKQLMKV